MATRWVGLSANRKTLRSVYLAVLLDKMGAMMVLPLLPFIARKRSAKESKEPLALRWAKDGQLALCRGLVAVLVQLDAGQTRDTAGHCVPVFASRLSLGFGQLHCTGAADQRLRGLAGFRHASAGPDGGCAWEAEATALAAGHLSP